MDLPVLCSIPEVRVHRALEQFPRWVPVECDGLDCAWKFDRDDVVVGADAAGETVSVVDGQRRLLTVDIEEAMLEQQQKSDELDAVFCGESPFQPFAPSESDVAPVLDDPEPWPDLVPDVIADEDVPAPFDVDDDSSEIPLSEDQIEARAALMRALHNGDQVLVLTGAAGTGKTTLVRSFVRGLSGFVVVYAAPTGKAASRLSEVTGQTCATVHSLIYTKPRNEGRCPDCDDWSAELAMSNIDLAKKGLKARTCPRCEVSYAVDGPVDIEVELRFTLRGEEDEAEIVFGSHTLVIVDEASMVDTELHMDLLRAVSKFQDCRILYVGDPYQLPPVNAEGGPDFEHPTAVLTQVHRQAEGSAILNAATLIRTRATKSPFDGIQRGADLKIIDNADLNMACKWLAERRELDIDATLITYTNEMRRAANHQVRKTRGLLGKSSTGLTPGDRLLIRANNKVLGYMKGEVYTVEDVSWVSSEGLRLVKDKEVLKVELVGRDAPVFIAEAVFGDEFREFESWLRPHKRAWESTTSTQAAFGGNEELSVEKIMLSRKIDKLRELARDQQGKPEGITAGMKADELALKLVDTGKRDPFADLLDPGQFIHADFGECITAHTSQGSQYAEVGIIWNSSLWGLWHKGKSTLINGQEVSEGRRWTYTSVTRAQQKLNVWFVK